jgi:hypothetical protein
MGLMPSFARGVVVNGAIHHAVIGDGEGGHIGAAARCHVFDAIGAVKANIRNGREGGRNRRDTCSWEEKPALKRAARGKTRLL